MTHLAAASSLREASYPDIASEHARLASLIEIIETKLREDNANYLIVADHIRELMQLAREHFEHEEVIMEREQYSQKDYHIQNHQHLLRSLADYVALCEKGVLNIEADAGKNIRGWFSFHTRTVDEEFREWLANKGPHGH